MSLTHYKESMNIFTSGFKNKKRDQEFVAFKGEIYTTVMLSIKCRICISEAATS